MSRLQKKCFFASATMHVLLMSILIVAPAFLTPEKRANDLPVLTLIPSKLIDDALFGSGGSPKAEAPAPKPAEVSPPPAPVLPERQVQPAPPKPEPVRPDPKVTKPIKPVVPEPDRVQPKKNTPPKPNQTEVKEKPKKPEIQPSLTKASQTSPKERAEKARADKEAEAKARANYIASLDKLGKNLGKNLSSETSIEMPLGLGGEAYANYGQVVKSKYQNEWSPPADLADDSATVSVEVTIARDGNVLSARITQKSGVPALDKSVQRALGIPFIAPFPEGSKDLKRTFIIDFNLKTKRSSG